MGRATEIETSPSVSVVSVSLSLSLLCDVMLCIQSPVLITNYQGHSSLCYSHIVHGEFVYMLCYF